MGFISIIVNGDYKITYNWGGAPPCRGSLQALLLRKRGPRGRGRGRGRGRRRGEGRSDQGRGRQGRGGKLCKKRDPSADSGKTQATSDESSASPETKRVKKAEKAFTTKKTVKKLKRLQEDDSPPCVQNPGVRTSSLGDFLEFVCSKVVNAAEIGSLKRLAAEGKVHYAEFCAGMATGTMAFEPWDVCFDQRFGCSQS